MHDGNIGTRGCRAPSGAESPVPSNPQPPQASFNCGDLRSCQEQSEGRLPAASGLTEPDTVESALAPQMLGLPQDTGLPGAGQASPAA